MKIVTGWIRQERGLAIGILVGALTVGASLPYLFRALGAVSSLDWHASVASTSAAVVLGGLLVGGWVGRGPFDVAAPRFSLAVARRVFALLAAGPLVGIVTTWRLRLRPEAVLMGERHR